MEIELFDCRLLSVLELLEEYPEAVAYDSREIKVLIDDGMCPGTQLWENEDAAFGDEDHELVIGTVV